jgi:hypothetical protein
MRAWSLINAGFELAGALAAWANVRELMRVGGQAKGVYLPAWLLSAAWGLCGIPYYLSLGDHWSVWGCAVRDTGTLTWLGIVVWNRRRLA